MKQKTGKAGESTTLRGLGLVLGAGVGTVLGAVFGSAANGAAFGIALGLGLGTLFDIRSNRKDSNSLTKPSDGGTPE